MLRSKGVKLSEEHVKKMYFTLSHPSSKPFDIAEKEDIVV